MRSVAVVGAGFGGVGAAAMLRRAGYPEVTVFERSDRIGGVWDANTYPGAACDIPSHLYEFSFAPNPHWTRRYAPQAEIRAYLEDVARRHGVRDRIHTGIEVQAARWSDDDGQWTLTTSAGEHRADVLLTACGQLLVPSVPAFPNLFLIYGPNTNGGNGSVVYTIEAGINHVIAALRALDRSGSRQLEVRSEAAGGFDADLGNALRGTVWHGGCTNWYVDEHGEDPNQWPWTWSGYRRRTATLAPGAYAFRAPDRSPAASLG